MQEKYFWGMKERCRNVDQNGLISRPGKARARGAKHQIQESLRFARSVGQDAAQTEDGVETAEGEGVGESYDRAVRRQGAWRVANDVEIQGWVNGGGAERERHAAMMQGERRDQTLDGGGCAQ